MFRCQLCGTVVPPRTPSHRVVVQSRPKRYPYRPRANSFFRWVKGKHKKLHTDDPGGSGTAIVREVRACAACAANPAPGTAVCPSRSRRQTVRSY
jgi:hypothetical protein